MYVIVIEKKDKFLCISGLEGQDYALKTVSRCHLLDGQVVPSTVTYHIAGNFSGVQTFAFFSRTLNIHEIKIQTF